MLNRKKTAAFIAGLLICTASAASPAASFAEEPSVPAAAAEEVTDVPQPSDTYTLSGNFMYSLTHDGTVCIEDCKSTEESLVIPDTLDGIAVTELGAAAFGSDVESIPYTSITLPASINYISSGNPFMYCTGLREIKVADGNTSFCVKDGVLYTKSMDELICCPTNMDGDSLDIPDSVKIIRRASLYNSKLSSVKFPASLEEIGIFALADTVNLKTADLSGTKLSNISEYAFSGCTALEEISFPDTLETIGGGAFASCRQMREITFPESLISVGQYAFVDNGFSAVIIPESVQNIAYCAFGYYTGEDGSIIADRNFTIVGRSGSAAQIYATDSDTDYEYQNNFTFLTNQQYIEQQDLLALDRVKSGDFEYAETSTGTVLTMCSSSDEKVTVPDTIDGHTVTMIYPACFSSCQASEIILPDTITEIREMAFYNAPNLKTITVPASVKKIGNNAFDNCLMLESVEFGGAETIGSQVFCNCDALKKVTVASTLKEWNDDEPFVYCTSLEEINVGEGDGNFSSENGVLYNKEKSKLIAYPANKSDKNFTVPASVKEIAQSAFMNADNLVNAELTGVENIGTYAFEGCDSLSSVRLSKKLHTIGTDAFYDCGSLKKLRVYDALTNIGTCAFGYCHNDGANAENNEAADKITEGFRLYAPKNSTAYKFGESAGMEVISDTVEFFGKNVDVRFLGAVGGIIAAALLAFIGVLTGKRIKKNKAAKKQAEKKEKAAERRRQQSAEKEPSESSENVEENSDED